MKKLITTLAVATFITSCSSNKSKAVKDVDNTDTIQKDYIVRDAKSNYRPGWTVDANDWADERDLDTKTFKYFSFETEPKVSREMACNLARANARADIAGEITTFIKKSLGASQEGQAAIDPNNPNTQCYSTQCYSTQWYSKQ